MKTQVQVSYGSLRNLSLLACLQAYCLKVKEMDDEEYEAVVSHVIIIRWTNPPACERHVTVLSVAASLDHLLKSMDARMP